MLLQRECRTSWVNKSRKPSRRSSISRLHDLLLYIRYYTLTHTSFIISCHLEVVLFFCLEQANSVLFSRLYQCLSTQHCTVSSSASLVRPLRLIGKHVIVCLSKHNLYLDYISLQLRLVSRFFSSQT